jgi:hypothetical protein
MPSEETSRRPRGLRRVSWTGWERLYGYVPPQVDDRFWRAEEVERNSSPHANDLAGTDNEKETKKIWNERSNREQAV